MTGAEKLKGLAAVVTRVAPDPKKQLTLEQEERIALLALMFLLGEPQVKRDNQVPSSTATQN